MSNIDDQDNYNEEHNVEDEDQIEDDSYYSQPKEEKKGSSSWVIILFILAIIEAGVIGFLIYSNNETSTELATKTTEVADKTKEVESKTKELDEMKNQFLELQAENERLGVDNTKLQEDLAQVNLMIEEAKNSNMSVGQIKAKYEKKLKGLRKELALQFQQIKVLKLENEKLTGDVSSLTQEKGKLGDSLKDINTEKEELAKQVALASVLKAEKIEFSTLNSKGKEYKGTEFSPKNISKLRMSFTIGDNKVAKKERKTIYFALIDASGSVFTDISAGGGTVTINGDLKSYTEKMPIDFDNTLQKVTLVYQKENEFEKGRYRLVAYCDGAKIGDGSFLVK